MVDKSPKILLDSGGEKPALIFLHGFCESKQIWEPFTQPLKQHYRIILLDLPGFGDNSSLPADYSMEASATFVQSILTYLQVQKGILVGHSMGGYVALAFAQKYPEWLAGLCLFHSSALPDTDEKKQNRNKSIEFIRKHGLAVFMDSFVAPLFYEGNREAQAETIKLLAEVGKRALPEAVIGTVEAMRDRPDRTQVLQEANFPVLFIAGKYDQAVTLEQTLQQCYLPKEAHVLFLDKTGHLGMFEKPAETLATLKSFADNIFSRT